MSLACPHCDGDLVRWGVCHYKRRPDVVGVRYRCRDCGKTMIHRVPAAEDVAMTRKAGTFPSGGRPIRRDWRYAA